MLSMFVCSEQCTARPLDNLYLKLSGGFIQYNKVKSKNSTIYRSGQRNNARPAFEGGIGYDINDYVKLEALVHGSRLHYENKKSRFKGRQKIKTIAATANLSVSANRNQYQVAPFLTFGCGVGINDASDWKSPIYGLVYRGHKNRNFVWTGGGGVIFSGLSRSYSCEIGYKHLGLGQIKVDEESAYEAYLGFQKPRLSGQQLTASVSIYL